MIGVEGLILLDGGTGHLLKERGVESLVGTGLEYDQLFLAGSLANQQGPELVKSVHADYIAAGVGAITTNNFSCTAYSLSKVGRQHLARDLTVAAARLAREAADQADPTVLVAGSLPPLQESYQTRDLPSPPAMLDQYQSIASALAPYVDLLLCETLASIAEGVAAAAAASGSGKPWWISWTLQDNEQGRLRSGEALEDAVAAVAQLPGLQAVLVNCCAPQAVTAAIPRLRACVPVGLWVGGYANGFRTTTSEWLASSGGEGGAAGEGPGYESSFVKQPADDYDADGLILPEAYARHACRWHSLGASIIGGCCGVGPRHIACVAQALAAEQQQQEQQPAAV